MAVNIPAPNTITELPFGLPGTVYRSPLPFGSFDPNKKVLSEWVKNGVTLVYSLIEADEWLEKASQDARPSMETVGILRVDYPIEDFWVPQDPAGFQAVTAQALKAAEKGKNLAIHCNAGWGRTGIFITEMAIQHFAYSVDDAITWVRQYVPPAVENQDQYQFLVALHT